MRAPVRLRFVRAQLDPAVLALHALALRRQERAEITNAGITGILTATSRPCRFAERKNQSRRMAGV
jgi:hypothetical protein